MNLLVMHTDNGDVWHIIRGGERVGDAVLVRGRVCASGVKSQSTEIPDQDVSHLWDEKEERFIGRAIRSCAIHKGRKGNAG
jgi:hypothetical protein